MLGVFFFSTRLAQAVGSIPRHEKWGGAIPAWKQRFIVDCIQQWHSMLVLPVVQHKQEEYYSCSECQNQMIEWETCRAPPWDYSKWANVTPYARQSREGGRKSRPRDGDLPCVLVGDVVRQRRSSLTWAWDLHILVGGRKSASSMKDQWMKAIPARYSVLSASC